MIGCCQAAGLARSESIRPFSARLPSENTNETTEPALTTNGFILEEAFSSLLKGQFTQTTKTLSVLGAAGPCRHFGSVPGCSDPHQHSEGGQSLVCAV